MYRASTEIAYFFYNICVVFKKDKLQDTFIVQLVLENNFTRNDNKVLCTEKVMTFVLLLDIIY